MYVLIVLVSAIVGVLFLEERRMQAIDERLSVAAKSLKFMLAEDFHDRAKNKNSITFEEELRNRKAITSFAEQSGFVYVYTLIERDGKYYFAAPTVTEEEAKTRKRWYFYPYEDIPESFVRAMRDGVAVFSSYTDQWGTFRSVAIPETSPGGVRYLACADLDISFIDRQQLIDFIIAGGFAGLLILSSLPLLILYRRFNKQHIRQLTTMNEDLVKAYEELEESDNMKSSILTKVSHELRTPLTSILGFVKLVLRDFERNFAPKAAGDMELTDKKRRITENLTIVSKESERLKRLINDNLDLFKIEANKMEWSDEPVSPKEAAEEAMNALQGELQAISTIELRMDVAPDLPNFIADPDKVHQLLINLLNNALKFTELGSVTLRVDQHEDCIRFRVEDTGVGIRKEDQATIFDEFYRSLHNDTVKDLRKGTGLGLAICYQIVKHYGGSIWVESEFGQGTTFTVLFKI